MEGQVALITGSAQGIGKTFAEVLLQKGVKVCISDILEDLGNGTVKELREKYGQDNVLFHKCDVTSEDQLEGLFKYTLSKFGRVDIVINNAGILQEHRFRLMMEINMMAVINGTRLAIKYMGTDNNGKGGLVVNTASIAGLMAYDIAPGYTAVKHAVVGYTRAIGRISVLAHGVRVVGVCPTFVDTKLIQFDPEEAQKGLLYGPDVMTRLGDSLGRTGSKLVSLPEVGECFRRLLENQTISGHVMLIGPSGSGWATRLPDTIEDTVERYVPKSL